MSSLPDDVASPLPTPDTVTVANRSTEIVWHPASRIARVSYTAGATLSKGDGELLVEALSVWARESDRRFGVLADAAGLRGTDVEYRAIASGFFRRHRETCCIALINVGPVIHIVVELFRIGTGIPLKTFSSEAAARSWLRSAGEPG